MGSCTGNQCLGGKKKRESLYRDEKTDSQKPNRARNQMEQSHKKTNQNRQWRETTSPSPSIHENMQVIRRNSELIQLQNRQMIDRPPSRSQMNPQVQFPSFSSRIRPDEGQERQEEQENNSLDLLVIFHLIRSRNPEMTDGESLLVLLRLVDMLNSSSGPEGLNEQEMSTLKYFESKEENLCAICQDSISIGETIIGLPCSHPFHIDCIKPWFERARSCPLCRQPAVRS